MNLTKEVELTRYDRGKIEVTPDIVVREYPLTVYINGQELVTLLCSPENLDYLSLGFLLSEGIIKDKSEIEAINIDEQKGAAQIKVTGDKNSSKYFMGKGMLATGSGRGTIYYNVFGSLGNSTMDNGTAISYKNVISLMKDFSAKSEIFQNTGGVHSAALSDGDKILVFHEDVGRHNALDKVIGEAFMKGFDFSDKILLLSGRISSEMLTKAAKRNISVVISRSAPMDLALKIGKEINMTIIGFARGERFNIYSGKERIIFDT